MLYGSICYDAILYMIYDIFHTDGGSNRVETFSQTGIVLWNSLKLIPDYVE